MCQLNKVSVAVEGTRFHFDSLYSYLWPKESPNPSLGLRVMVPFGKGNRQVQGVVMKIEQAENGEKLKYVSAVLDEVPLFNEEMIRLAFWMKERTFCTLYDALRTMLPPGLMIRMRPTYRLGTINGEVDVSETEAQVLELLEAVPEGFERKDLLKSLGLSDESTVLESMRKKGLVVVSTEAVRVAGDASAKMVRLTDEFDETDLDGLTPKQEMVLNLIRDAGMVSVKEVCYMASVTSSVVLTLEKKGLVVISEEEVLRSHILKKYDKPELQSQKLNEEQQNAFEGLSKLSKTGQPKTALLFGVTGSGKTQVYMNLIDDVLARGKQVLVLIPEISLTPQMLDIFTKRYGSRVAVSHSGLSVGERMDEWKRIQRGESSVVIGTRSAVFAPLKNIGLIIFDEEQEHTYKSENSPRYHAREIAMCRCQTHKALLLLASATPSVESFCKAKQGEYSLFTLGSRYGEAKLPEVKISDLREDPGEGAIGEELFAEIKRTLAENKQIILLLNRRGFNTFVSCKSCGHVLKCPSCSVSMTYHHANNRLMCHYCGHMEPVVSVCPECGSDKVRYSGFGTQKVEDELKELFPNVAVLRMDADTTMSRYAYESKFQDFRDGKYDIMIGTQMVAKGLDFPNVGLVGIVSADQSLYAEDYRCYETSFDLFTQVIGRAGRRGADSLAVIQTFTPENEVIALAAEQNYSGFYEKEMAARRLLKYPPYSDLCQFGFVGRNEKEVKSVALRFTKRMEQLATSDYKDVPVWALSPSPAYISKASGKYRYKFIIKTKNRARTREMIATLLKEFGKAKDVSVFADINPASML